MTKKDTSAQRFTRTINNMQIPFIVAGNGGNGLARIQRNGEPMLRTPTPLALDGENVIFENYDDTDFDYLRVTVDENQLRIEYQPVPATGPSDGVAVDLKNRRLMH
jgi:hypothetical protein